MAKKEKIGDGGIEGGWVFVDSSNSSVIGVIDKGTRTGECAKWCHISEDGMVELSRKLKCLLLPGERYDSKLMRELVRGSVVTERLHPLIFEASVEGESETVQFRSIQFFEQLVADAADGISDKYQSLSAKQKRIVGVGVRDLFLASSSRQIGRAHV